MKMLLKALAVLLLPFAALAQTTVTVPPPSCTATAPTITCKSVQLTIPGTTTPPVVTPPVVTPPAAGTLWVYYNGQFNWAGAYNFGNQPYTVAYDNPTSTALSGTKDVLVTGDVGWQPYAFGNDFPTGPYKTLTISIRPTQAGNTWVTGAEMVGDKNIPGGPVSPPSIMPYGPNPAVVGKWNTYNIPLTVLGIKDGIHIYKFMVLEQSSSDKAHNQVEFSNVGFVP
jgi:hypothetical protein